MKLRALSALTASLVLIGVVGAQTTAHLSVNVWCQRTTGQGHDSISEKAAFIGPWADGKNVVEFNWDFGGWKINDRGGFDSQEVPTTSSHSASIQTKICGSTTHSLPSRVGS